MFMEKNQFGKNISKKKNVIYVHVITLNNILLQYVSAKCKALDIAYPLQYRPPNSCERTKGQ